MPSYAYYTDTTNTGNLSDCTLDAGAVLDNAPGDQSTYVESAGGGAVNLTVIIDLGTPQAVDDALVEAYYSTGSYSFSIAGSDDGSTWVEAYGFGGGGAPSSAWNAVTVSTGPNYTGAAHRYWRIGATTSVSPLRFGDVRLRDHSGNYLTHQLLLSATAAVSDTLITDAASRNALAWSRSIPLSLLTQTAFRGAQALAQSVTGDVFTDWAGASGIFRARAAQSDLFATSVLAQKSRALAETLLTQTVGQGLLYRTRSLTEALLTNSVAQSALVRIQAVSDTLLTQSAGRGAFRRSEAITLSLLTDSLVRGGAHFSLRSLAAQSLLSEGLLPFEFWAAPDPNAPDNRDPFVQALLYLAHVAQVQRIPMIAASKLLLLLDKIAASYHTVDLAATSTTLGGLEPLIIGGDGLSSTVYGTGDEAFILKTVAQADAMVTASAPDTVNTAIYKPFMAALASYLASTGTTPTGTVNWSSLDTYATYQNTLAWASFLVHPNLAYINWLYASKQPTLLMAPSNVFAPATQFGAATVGPGAGVLTYTSQGGIPTVNDGVNGVQGYTPAPGLVAEITVTVNGTLTVTVTGNGVNAAGETVTGRTWTATLSNAAAGATVTFVPTVAGDRIASITSVVGTGTATAGAFTLNSVLERVVS